jgi:hypothetical protein
MMLPDSDVDFEGCTQRRRLLLHLQEMCRLLNSRAAELA